MRTFTLPQLGDLPAREVLVEVAKQPKGGVGNGAITVEGMRRDIRLLDVLEPAIGRVLLEEADWAHLCDKLRVFPFAATDRRLVQLCDLVLNAEEAKEHPAVMDTVKT